MPRHLKYTTNFRGLGEYTRESPELKRVIDRRADLGVRVAKALVPVHSGALRDSVHTEVHPVHVRRYGRRYGVRIVSNLAYATVREVGRRRRAPYAGVHAFQLTAKYLTTPKRARKV